MNKVIKFKAFSLSIYALRVFPAETRLTVYRRRPVLNFQDNDKSRNFGAKMKSVKNLTIEIEFP